MPKTNKEAWSRKLLANKVRDQRKVTDLRSAGFDVLTIWQCELGHSAAVLEKLRRFWEDLDAGNGVISRPSLFDPALDQRPESFRFDYRTAEIIRSVKRRDGSVSETTIAV